MNTSFKINHASPSPIEYIELRVEGGLSRKSLEAATIGLNNTLFSVCIYDQSTLIGLGRVVGDGGTVFHIVDIVVKPSYQGQGLGKVIMKEIMNYLEKNTYPGSYVSLIADDPANRLYEKFGFQYTYPKSHGMYKMY
ncbi:GNAT family N-acetyltransferase [Neobacillus sp. 114]|uniref:GNAT family N-acetyltransferase n=1 Tax=Neobacillus sp. 114 TaxID=3048535 RepID=UPI0024C3CF79|nr:GNAT family N-acetyltransferase [Neobacillus sp. 114]